MSTHDDRPGTGGYPGDRYGQGRHHSTAPPGGSGALSDQGDQRLGAGSYDYFEEDPGYSDTPEAATSVVQRPGSGDYYDELGRRGREFGWNAGTDLGLLLLRLCLGGVFMAHGAQKLFGAFGGGGTEAFAKMLQQSGFQQSAALSLVTGGTEFGGGLLVVLGLFTPLGAAGILGVMINAAALKLNAGFFAMNGGYELEVMDGAIALGLMFTGPGRIALDNGRAWFRRPMVSGTVCLLIAIAASVVVLALFH